MQKACFFSFAEEQAFFSQPTQRSMLKIHPAYTRAFLTQKNLFYCV